MITRTAAIAALLLLPFTALAQTGAPAAPTAAAAPDVKAFGGRVTGALEFTAVIEAVKADTREVTIRTSAGEAISFVAGPEVRNFAQIAVGDKLDIVGAEELTIIVTNVAKEPARTDTVDVARAPEGGKPGMVIVKRSKGSAVVDAIDYATRTATLRGPQRTVVIEASPEAVNFNEAKVGDTVLIDFVQTLLITVHTP